MNEWVRMLCGGVCWLFDSFPWLKENWHDKENRMNFIKEFSLVGDEDEVQWQRMFCCKVKCYQEKAFEATSAAAPLTFGRENFLSKYFLNKRSL